MGRGALIVLEGCDRAGKSTQAKMLVTALNARNIPTKDLRFPDRTTPVGGIINDYLTSKKEICPVTAHLLFSVNRWERNKDMRKLLEAGITLIVDRYAASGAAYGAANTGRDLSWCKESDRGLVAPDLVTYLTIDGASQELRNGWASERFENKDFQDKVAKNFLELQNDTWRIIEKGGIEEVHEKIFQSVIDILENVRDLPLKNLYDSQ